MMRAIEPYDDELLSSFLLRVALRKGMTLENLYTWAEVKPSTHSTIDQRPKEIGVLKLAARLGRDVEELQRLCVAPRPAVLPLNFCTGYCVSCWDGDVAAGRSPYVRKTWVHAWCVHCSTHKQLLTDLYTERHPECVSSVWGAEREWARAAHADVRLLSTSTFNIALTRARNPPPSDPDIGWLESVHALQPWIMKTQSNPQVDATRRVVRDLVLIAGLRFFHTCSLAAIIFPGNRANRLMSRRTRGGTFVSMRSPHEFQNYEGLIAPFATRQAAIRVAGRLWALLQCKRVRLDRAQAQFEECEAVFQHLAAIEPCFEPWIEARLKRWPQGHQQGWAMLRRRRLDYLASLRRLVPGHSAKHWRFVESLEKA